MPKLEPGDELAICFTTPDGRRCKHVPRGVQALKSVSEMTKFRMRKEEILRLRKEEILRQLQHVVVAREPYFEFSMKRSAKTKKPPE